MCSISRPSILISEDGRGVGFETLLGGLNFHNAYSKKDGFIYKIINKILSKPMSFSYNKQLPEELIQHIDYEVKFRFPGIKTIRNVIDQHYSVMKQFIQQLP